ncbi:MAG: DUF2513 domain-containing protein [Alphaproteobacteria bacterium]|nr:DUF2513 domain-containing protein [Alphaproteobacteria bacterium]MBQ8630309.1 DUF2513 domain-containing protein [Alphaproteobacteria bacterium]
MKQDYELIKLILQTLAENDSYCVPLDSLAKQIQEKTGESELFNDKFVGHFFLARDTKLIEELGVCFFTGQQYHKPVPANHAKLRITAQGLEFLEALKNDNIIHKIKEFSVGTAMDIGKSLLTNLISKQLGL